MLMLDPYEYCWAAKEYLAWVVIYILINRLLKFGLNADYWVIIILPLGILIPPLTFLKLNKP